MLSASIDFLKSFFKLVDRKDTRVGIRNVAGLLRVDGNINLSFILMKKTLFPEINQFCRYFPLLSKSVMINRFRLSQDMVIKLEALLFINW